jgi:hypothetical protein
MNAGVKQDTGLDIIEHLDWAPMCALLTPTCGNQNPATLIVTWMCCGWRSLVCRACVCERQSHGVRNWIHRRCGVTQDDCYWLDTVILHPLGGKR